MGKKEENGPAKFADSGPVPTAPTLETAIDNAVQAVNDESRAQDEKQEPAQQPELPYRVDGVDLSPAFTAILDQLAPVRARLMKALGSTTARNFREQREDLLRFQSLVRAFDVLAGYMTPDGRQLATVEEVDLEAAKRREDYVDDTVGRANNLMQRRAELYSDVPLEPRQQPRMLRPLGPPQTDYAPKKKGWLRT